MNANMSRADFVKPVAAMSPRVELRRVVGKVAHAAATFAKAISAGREAAYLAERYYTMNAAQLACIGLKREQIPAELLRVLSR